MILPSEVHITRGRDLASGIPPPSTGHRAKAGPNRKDKSHTTSQAAASTAKETRVVKGAVENGPIELTGVSMSEEDSSAEEDAPAEQDHDSSDGASGNRTSPPPQQRPKARGGVVVRNAIVDKTDKMCASGMRCFLCFAPCSYSIRIKLIEVIIPDFEK